MIIHPTVINELFKSSKWMRDNFKYKLTVLVSSVDAVELAEFEDILLSATAKAFRRFKPKLRTKFTTYLHTIYLNKFKDFKRHLRRLYKRKALYFGEQSSEPASNLSENGNYYLKFFKSRLFSALFFGCGIREPGTCIRFCWFYDDKRYYI